MIIVWFLFSVHWLPPLLWDLFGQGLWSALWHTVYLLHQQKIIKLWELWRALEYSGALQSSQSLIIFCWCVSVHQGSRVCVGVIFSMFFSISFMISCIVDFLNFLSMPDFLLVGITGRGGGAALCLSASHCRWVSSCSCTRFVELIFAASHTAAHCSMWSSRIWRGGVPDSTCMVCISVVVKTGSIVLRNLFCIFTILFIWLFFPFCWMTWRLGDDVVSEAGRGRRHIGVDIMYLYSARLGGRNLTVYPPS